MLGNRFFHADLRGFFSQINQKNLREKSAQIRVKKLYP